VRRLAAVLQQVLLLVLAILRQNSKMAALKISSKNAPRY
jgi:hypothetical protein